MTRICMVVHNTYHTDPRVQRYAESLANAGVQVDVLCLRGDHSVGGPTSPNITVIPIPLKRFAQGIPGYAVEYLLGLVLFAAWLLFLSIKHRYDVIHIHNMPDFLILSALIPRLFGAKVILDIHDPMPELYSSKFESRRGRLLQGFMRLQERFSAHYADAVITANPTFAEKLAGRGIAGDKITVVNNVPDAALFDRSRYSRLRSAPRDHFVLICPGTVAPRYGLEVAIRALPQLCSRIQNLRLVIVGKPSPEAVRLQGLAEELGVSTWVEFRRGLPLHEMPELMAQADVGIYTGLSDAHMDAAVPTKVLEYAWMGLPIVSSRLPVLENMFDDSAILFFEPGNSDQFAACVLRLYETPHLREKLVQRADEVYVKSHNWRHECQAYFGLLNRLLPAARKVHIPREVATDDR